METITLDGIQAARERIAAHVTQTPATGDEVLGRRLGAEIWFKWENRQKTGAFKLRGALNKILSLPSECVSRGVLAASSGNHGHGLAYATRLLGMGATIYVPDDTPRKKLRGMARLGARVVTVPGDYGVAEEMALAVAGSSEEVWVSAYNDPAIIAGAGTLALEWLEQVQALDLLLVPAGGGGLVSGVGLAVKALKPQVRVVGVQAEASAALHAAFYGHDVDAVTHRSTLADGLAGPIENGSITIPLVKQVVDEILLVSEAEIERGVAYAYRVHGEVIEGAGAVGLAALLAGKVNCAGHVTGLLVSGGNVDPDRHAEILARQSGDTET
jgi:threonine dehydratase